LIIKKHRSWIKENSPDKNPVIFYPASRREASASIPEKTRSRELTIAVVN
jgi:hypothetical protein